MAAHRNITKRRRNKVGPVGFKVLTAVTEGITFWDAMLCSEVKVD
jgi:hypothetical protein